MRYLLVLVALMGAVFGLEKLFFFHYPQYDFDLLSLIPAFFIFLGSVAYQLGSKPIGNGVAVIMGLKALRMLLSILFIFCYVFFIETNAISFVMSYFVFFIVYLSFETWMFSQINKKK